MSDVEHRPVTRGPELPGSRETFVIQIHPDGKRTLENVRTRERVLIDDLTVVGAQIERWMGRTPSRDA